MKFTRDEIKRIESIEHLLSDAYHKDDRDSYNGLASEYVMLTHNFDYLKYLMITYDTKHGIKNETKFDYKLH